MPRNDQPWPWMPFLVAVVMAISPWCTPALAPGLRGSTFITHYAASAPCLRTIAPAATEKERPYNVDEVHFAKLADFFALTYQRLS